MLNENYSKNLWHVLTGVQPAPFWFKSIVSLSILIIYAFLFIPLSTILHDSVIAFALLPIFFVGNMFGILGGVVIGFVLVPLDWVLLNLSVVGTGLVEENFWVPHGFFLVAGILFGYLHDMHIQLRQELDQRRKMEKELEYLATHDPLTGIPNRMMFYQCARTAISRALRRGEGLAFLFIDLDDFKEVNDKYGHALGDKVLVEIGKRILEGLRESDCVARIGGDEFAVVLESVWEQDTIGFICKRLLSSISKPIQVNGHQVLLHGSIGISQYPHHGDTVETLLHKADSAMYLMKNTGKNSYVFYGKQEVEVLEDVML